MTLVELLPVGAPLTVPALEPADEAAEEAAGVELAAGVVMAAVEAG